MAGWGMNLLGYSALLKSFNQMIPKGSDVWEIGPNTNYDVYVELGTTRARPQPYVAPGAKKVMSEFAVHEAQADDLNDLLRILALSMEREMKFFCPVDTGTLQGSIEAVKVK